MILEVENKKNFINVSFKEIERNLLKLKSYGKNSFAILSDDRGNFIQVAGGGVTCVVERKSFGESTIYRAFLIEPRNKYEGLQEIYFGGGSLKVNPNEILFISDVIDCFKSFYDNISYPKSINWTDVKY